MGKRGKKRAPRKQESDGSDSEGMTSETKFNRGSSRIQDDEEISEDGAFNSDDEKEFGEFFQGKRGNAEDEDEDEDLDDENEETLLDKMFGSSDEENRPQEESEQEDESESEEDSEEGSEEESDDESDDEATNVDVAGLVDELIQASSKKEQAKKAVERANRAANDKSEDSFATKNKGKLTLDAMIGSLQNRPEFGALKKRLEGLENTTKITEALPKVLEERAERQVGYEKASKEVSEWVGVVQKNRKADHISFPLNAPGHARTSTGTIASTFKAENDLEKEIQEALRASGLADEDQVIEDEKRLLEVNKVDPEQVKERQKELAKLRALMFYSEQKSKRTKKIKSKMFRKLKKRREAREEEKAMEQLKEVDPEAYKELEQKAALDRAKERMTLKHKNTSKFIRGLLKHGGLHQEHTRTAIMEQLEQEQRLRRRMKSLNPDDTKDSDDENEDSEDEGQDLSTQAESLIREIQQDQARASAVDGTKLKGLHALKFMQKGAEKQRQQAKAEAELLLKAIQSGELPEDLSSDGVDVSTTGRRKFGAIASSTEKQAAQEGQNEDQDRHNASKESARKPVVQSASLELDSHTSSFLTVRSHAKPTQKLMFQTPSFPAPPQLEDQSSSSSESENNNQSKKVPIVKSKRSVRFDENTTTRTGQEKKDANSPPQQHKHRLQDKEEKEEEEANPWLSSNKVNTKRHRNETTSVEKVQVDVAKSVIDKTKTDKSKKSKKAKQLTEEELEAEKKRREQAKLIRRAFAGTGALEQDFHEEKARMEEEEEEANRPKEEKMASLPGWGSWAGAGIESSKPLKRKPTVPPPTNVQKSKKQKRNGPKHVIVSEKRLKQTEKYMVDKVPYPFTSREQYEQSLRNPIGNDWNTAKTFTKAVKPQVITKAGTIIKPIEKPKHE